MDANAGYPKAKLADCRHYKYRLSEIQSVLCRVKRILFDSKKGSPRGDSLVPKYKAVNFTFNVWKARP